MAQQGTNDSRQDARNGFAGWFHVPFVGIACVLAWAFQVNALAGTGDVSDQTAWIASYVALSLVMPIMGLIAKRIPRVVSFKAIPFAAAAAGAVGTIGIFTAGMMSMTWLLYASTIMCACVIGWLYLQWALFFIRLDVSESIFCLFAANIIGSLMKEAMHLLPPVGSCLAAACLPALSVLLCLRATALVPKPEARGHRFGPGTFKSLWKVGATIVVFSFVTAYLIGSFSGNQSMLSLGEFTAARIFEIFVSLAAIATARTLKGSFNFAHLWRIILLVLAIDLVCVIVLPQYPMLRCVESSVWDLLVIFSWLTIADIARHMNEPPAFVFGMTWPAYTLPFALGTLATGFMRAHAIGGVSDAFIALLMFALLVTALICLETRDQDTKQIFANEKAPASRASMDEGRTLETRCNELAGEFKLTPREVEVMMYLYRGRTKAYIAETLFLTENTVRGHAKHLYAKLDVHSRRELLDLIDAVDTDSQRTDVRSLRSEG